MKNKKKHPKLQLLKNSSWKQWPVRKFSFMYCLIASTILIAWTGFLAYTTDHIDTAIWIQESLKQFRFIIGTGTLIVLLPFDELKKVLLSKFAENLEEDLE